VSAQVEVVDDLVAEVADVLHEARVGLDVAEHAEAAEHLLAEAVGGGDGGRVEVGEGGSEPLAPQADQGLAAGREQRHDRVVVRGRAGQRPLEALLGADQPLAHALAQLTGRHAREGHHQDLLQRDAVGDVAGGERGDRERLAGTGARLEHGHAGRERAADVEGLGHRYSTCSQARTSSHSRLA
jgi:hypothetical protein